MDNAKRLSPIFLASVRLAVIRWLQSAEKSKLGTDHGWVIEFQHPYLKPEERRSRDIFYPKLVWLVDGVRRKRDRGQILNAWKEGVPIGTNSLVRRVSSDECALLREWAGGRAPIFFDLGEEQVLWWLLS